MLPTAVSRHKSAECHPKWIHYIEKEIVRLKANR